jgi:cell division protease FtsH
MLLVGPPGTGKTLLARAVAGEAGVRFFSISGSEFVEMFVGVGAARVRDLFEQARQQAPAIIFIDELDALGRARGGVFLGGGHDEKEQTLNQLLTEMDGFDPTSGIVLLAATNRPEILDPALLRAGRFDRQVLVDRPDKKGRIDILRVHVKRVKLASDVSLENVAALTPGFTGADLANLVNEAALLATRRSAEAVTLDDFTQAIERIVAGLEKRNKLLNPHERNVVAHHEMGHTILVMALPGVDPVQKVSIIPRGIAALGYTIQRPTEDRFLIGRSELVNRMTVLLGGGRPSVWSSARSRRARRTTWPRPPRSPAAWSPGSAWIPSLGRLRTKPSTLPSSSPHRKPAWSRDVTGRKPRPPLTRPCGSSSRRSRSGRRRSSCATAPFSTERPSFC